MKIGVISDVHSNPMALRAVLDEFRGRNVDKIICLGDVIGIGTFPEETVRTLMAADNIIAFLKGNHESYLLDGIPDRIEGEERAFHQWEHARLSPQSIEFLHTFSDEYTLDIDGVRLWAAHYPSIDGIAPPEVVAANCPNADICLYGHDHARCVRFDSGRLFADFGALGCPGKDIDIARAGIVTVENGAFSAETLDVRYDAAAVVREMDALDPPARRTIQRIFYGIDQA